jgi:hypothetical protein
LFLSVPAALCQSIGEIKAVSPESLSQPSPDQLSRGNELVARIDETVREIPLTSPEAVLKKLGIDQIHIQQLPTHQYVTPLNGDASGARRFGISRVSMQVSIDDAWRVTNRLNGHIDLTEACVTIDQVMRRFGVGTAVGHAPLIYAHPTPQPPRVQAHHELTFQPLSTPTQSAAIVAFGFEYQICARYFSVSYIR